MEKKAQTPSSSLQENWNWGPGLFVSEKAQSSFDEAYLKIGILLKDEGAAPVLPDKETCYQLIEACRYYWADHEYDARDPLIDIRDEINDLLEGLDVLLPALDKLSDEARARLEFDLRPSQARRHALIPKMRNELERLRSICAPMAKHRGAKKGSGRTSVANCCARLITLRAHLTGKPFAKTWSVLPTKDNTTEAFVGRDAQFILEMMRAIDGRVMISNVRSAGMTLARQRARKK